jgi:hypothetical protein
MKSISKILMISAICLVVTVSVFVLLIQSSVQTLTEINSEAVRKKTDLKTLEEQIVAFRNSQKDLAVASDREKIIQSIVVKENLEVPIKKIEEAAVKSNSDQSLLIRENDMAGTGDSFHPMIKSKGNVEEVPYTISSTTNFLNLIKFLQYVEHLPNFSEVSSLSLSAIAGTTTGKDSQATHSGNILTTIEAVFFVQKP